MPVILKELNEKGYEIGVASRTSEIQGAYQLLKLFGWEKYIKYTEIYPGCKVKHFAKWVPYTLLFENTEDAEFCTTLWFLQLGSYPSKIYNISPFLLF